LRVYDMDIANLFLFCAIQGDMAFTFYLTPLIYCIETGLGCILPEILEKLYLQTLAERKCP